MRNNSAYSILMASAMVGVTSPLHAANQPDKSDSNKKPNIIFIMVDDYGWTDTGYNNNNNFYETPNIDRLAKAGMEFTNGYSAAPISSPARVSLMTGKYPARTRITDWIPGYQYNISEEQLTKYKMCVPKMPLDMPLEEVTIAEALKESNYKTYHVGKWHCSEHEPFYPQYQGFDENIGGWLSGSPKGNRRSQGGEGAYHTPYNNPYLSDGPSGEYLTDRLGSECINIINKSKDDPFFLYLGFYAVHTPIEPKLEVVEYFKEKAAKMGIDKNEAFDENSDLYKYQDKKAWHWKERITQNDPEYAALIYSMDENVGRVLDALKENGLEDNTIVCLLGDNGGLSTAEGSPTCNAPLRAGKGWLYEGGIRVPFLVKYPEKVKAGSKCDTPVVGVDFYPTLLELAGADLKPEQHKDGVSLVSMLEGEKQNRGDIFFHYPHYGGKGDAPAGAIRSGDYKLIEFYEDGHIELYNLKKDISETTNLAEKNPSLAAKLLSRLQQWRAGIDAQMPQINSTYIKQ